MPAGRPTKGSSARTERVTIAVSPAELAYLEAAADGHRLGPWARRILLGHALHEPTPVDLEN